jgi:hypothetical protein
MDRQRVETSVLSVLGTFCWIEVQPPEASGRVCRRVNKALSKPRSLRRVRRDRHGGRRRAGAVARAAEMIGGDFAAARNPGGPSWVESSHRISVRTGMIESTTGL